MIRRRDTGLHLILDPQRAEASLWRRARFENDLTCRRRLFERYMPLARSVAARYRRWRWRTVDGGDLEQFAFEGLLEALDRFDPLRGVPFGAYARRRMSGSINDGMARMSDFDAQVSHRRRLRQERLRLLSEERGVDPIEALADLVTDLALGLMLEETGLIEPEDGIDHRPDPFQSLAWRQAQAALAAEVARLPETEAVVVRQHYEAGLTFAHIAELLRLSRGRVAQLHRAALDRLRRRLRSFQERNR